MQTALYLIPVTLGGELFEQVIPAYNIEILKKNQILYSGK